MFPIFAGNSASTGYNLTRSLRFRASASAYLNRTPASTGNRQIWTYSLWIKRGALSTARLFSTGYIPNTSNADMVDIYFSGDNLNIFMYDSATVRASCSTSAVFRDPAAWYHIVFAIDTTQATSSNRIKFYVNNVLQTFSSATYPAQNYNTFANTSGVLNSIGRYLGNLGSPDLDGYLTEVNFIDGQALTPSSFGSTNALTGVWQPAAYTGTYGTNGFKLQFTDNSALTTSSNVGLGKDFSGNANYWVTNNISITAGVTYDSMTDVPTLTSATAANFAVLNPLKVDSTLTVSNGNLLVAASGTNSQKQVFSTIAMPLSGKWYWEIYQVGGSNRYNGIGTVTTSQAPLGTGSIVYNQNGDIALNGSVVTSGLATNTTGDTLGVAVDIDNSKIYWYKNNTLVNSGGYSFTVGTTQWVALIGVQTTSDSQAANFGQRPFTYTAPTGFVALNTYNLPTSTIVKGNTVMDATLWTGNSSTQSIVNAAAFKTDFVWIKNRTGANNHALFDSVRGATKRLYSDSSIAEQTEATTLTAFNSNGFSLSSSGAVNASANNYVGWQWQAGQGTTSSNTNGSITSTVSVNASAGFSVVTWTGTGANATIGHGLGVAPQFIINKPRNAADNWPTWHTSLGALGYVYINLTNASVSLAAMWNSTLPTSSVFSVGTSSNINTSAQTMVSYCWTPIAGFSAFGSYTGNGSADGPFVYLGFRPKFVMIKRTDTAGFSWEISDSSRNPSNIVNLRLFADLSNADNTQDEYDYVSNGLKVRTTNTNTNASGGTYIYMAFAENPFKNALAR